MNFNKINTFNYINNQFENGLGNEKLEVLDKYSGELLSQDQMASDEQAEKALKAANRAFSKLKKLSTEERRSALEKLYDLISEKKEDFIQLIIAEAGKPRSYATAEIERSLTTLKLSFEEITRFSGETVPVDYGAGVGKTAFTKRFPIGPILCITPFNFPLNLLLHKVAPALALGCPVIVKAPPQTPLTAIALAKLIDQIPLPEGSYNVLSCANEQSQKLVEDSRIKMLSFTGSAAVGWKLKSLAGKKKVVLELGGNAAVLVDRGVDLKKCAKELAKGSYLYAGQICISTQRIYAHKKIYSDLCKYLIEEIKELPCGDPSDEKTLVGPIINSEHAQRVEKWIDEALNAGAEPLIKAQRLSKGQNVITPTLLTNTSSDMKVVKEEVFGPIALIEEVENFEKGIEAINNSDYGLQAGVYTDSIKNMKIAHDEIEVGAVIINSIPGFRVDSMPYGGVKDSGLGREGARYALLDMSEPRLLVY
jgi:glyceraldehyde-3-phosphate dehydrogenase (NADP+)